MATREKPKPTETKIRKSIEEIERAHDLLFGMMKLVDVGKLDLPNIDNIKRHLSDCSSVLCWLLGCTHNLCFHENMRMLEEILQEGGLLIMGQRELEILDKYIPHLARIMRGIREHAAERKRPGGETIQ